MALVTHATEPSTHQGIGFKHIHLLITNQETYDMYCISPESMDAPVHACAHSGTTRATNGNGFSGGDECQKIHFNPSYTTCPASSRDKNDPSDDPSQSLHEWGLIFQNWQTRLLDGTMLNLLQST